MILLPPSESPRVEGRAATDGSNINIAASSSSSNSSSSSSHQSTLGGRASAIGLADTSGHGGASVSFRASTNIEQYTIREASDPLRFPCTLPRRRISLFPSSEETPSVFQSTSELLNLSRDKRLRESTAAAAAAAEASVVEIPTVRIEETPTSPTPSSSSSTEPTTTNELDEFHARLLSLIECPVCLEPIAPPVHQCRRGHLVRNIFAVMLQACVLRLNN